MSQLNGKSEAGDQCISPLMIVQTRSDIPPRMPVICVDTHSEPGEEHDQICLLVWETRFVGYQAQRRGKILRNIGREPGAASNFVLADSSRMAICAAIENLSILGQISGVELGLAIVNERFCRLYRYSDGVVAVEWPAITADRLEVPGNPLAFEEFERLLPLVDLLPNRFFYTDKELLELSRGKTDASGVSHLAAHIYTALQLAGTGRISRRVALPSCWPEVNQAGASPSIPSEMDKSNHDGSICVASPSEMTLRTIPSASDPSVGESQERRPSDPAILTGNDDDGTDDGIEMGEDWAGEDDSLSVRKRLRVGGICVKLVSGAFMDRLITEGFGCDIDPSVTK